MELLELLHAADQRLHALDGQGVVTRSAETADEPVALDADHAARLGELHELGSELLVTLGHDETDVHERTVLGLHRTAEQRVAVDFVVKQLGLRRRRFS